MQVPKPNKEEHDAVVQEIGNAITAIQEEKAVVQKKIDEAMADPNSKAANTEARGKLDTLKARKGAMIKEKQALRASLEKMKTQSSKLVKDKNDVRSNIKFDTAEKIDAEILQLRRKQETTSMKLNDEKKLIREIEALQNSKKHIATLQSKNSALDNVQAQRKSIQEQLKSKDKEIDAVQAEMDTVSGFLKEQKDKNDKKRQAIDGLFKQREEINKRMKEKIKERDGKRTEFREANDKWYTYRRAIYAQKKMKEEEERKKREEEKAAYLAKLEEEEAKKIPYEEEQYLCDYLANFLEREYLKPTGKSEDASEKKSDFIPVKDDPFAGMKGRNKKDEEGEEFFGKKKAKKKRDRQSKKQNAVAPFSMSYDLIEQFSLIQLSHPNSVEEVEKSVKELREKKEWYSKQPRGSVPTAADIRKAKEAENAKTRKTPAAAPKQGNFTLKNDDFVPLSANTGNAVVTPWGAKAPEEEAAAVQTEG